MPRRKIPSDVPLPPDVPPDDEQCLEVRVPIEANMLDNIMEITVTEVMTTETVTLGMLEPNSPESQLDSTLSITSIDSSIASEINEPFSPQMQTEFTPSATDIESPVRSETLESFSHQVQLESTPPATRIERPIASETMESFSLQIPLECTSPAIRMEILNASKTVKSFSSEVQPELAPSAASMEIPTASEPVEYHSPQEQSEPEPTPPATCMEILTALETVEYHPPQEQPEPSPLATSMEIPTVSETVEYYPTQSQPEPSPSATSMEIPIVSETVEYYPPQSQPEPSPPATNMEIPIVSETIEHPPQAQHEPSSPATNMEIPIASETVEYHPSRAQPEPSPSATSMEIPAASETVEYSSPQAQSDPTPPETSMEIPTASESVEFYHSEVQLEPTPPATSLETHIVSETIEPTSQVQPEPLPATSIETPNASETIASIPPQLKPEPTLPATSIEKSIAMIFEDRRESCDTGYSSLENGEYKQIEEGSLGVVIRDALKPTPPFPVPDSVPVVKKPGRGRPRKNAKKEPKTNKKTEKEKSNANINADDDKDDDERESDEPRRSTRLKSKTDNTVRMEDLLNSINISEIVKTIEENSLKSNGCDIPPAAPDASARVAAVTSNNENSDANSNDSTESRPPFKPILENEYFTERSISKDAERMICDCLLTKEEIIRGEKGCGDDCLNRLLLIECCSRCTLGERCSNKRFQKREYAKCEAFKTKKKGYGLQVLEDIPSGTFIMEYVGEVIDSFEFETRAMKYARGKIPHFYFMSLKSDCIIDATVKGNISRFINHSCEPNAETQKWTVQGELRIGFFSKRDIKAGEEITFDYQLQRYGKQAQKCFCETPSCSGWIGENPEKQTTDDKKKEKKKKKADAYQDWETALDEICQVGLINRHQTLSLNRLMVHAKELPVRMQILQLIEEGHPACRRLFVDYHGLPLISSWMVDCTPEQDELKTQLLKTLLALPITNKTVLIDSKVLPLVEQWAYAVDQKPHSEQLSAQSVLESVEDIASADETPVSEMAQKVLEVWSSLREMYRIPKKERIQQMKEHEREADQNIVKPRPKRLPLYVENMRERYHRNRHSKDKDFDKIFFDRMKDYDKSGNNIIINRKRKPSPDRRNFDRNQRKFDSSSQPNKLSKMEHRYLFEMKYREKERKEEQQYWYQNASLYYANQQQAAAASISNLINTAAQYLTSVPPPNYTPDSVYSPISTVASATPTNNFFNTPPPNMYQNVVLPPTHIPPPSLPPTSMVQSQVSASPAQATPSYYQNQVHVPSYPPPTSGSYPMRATASTPITDAKPIPTTCQLRASPAVNSNYDYPGLTMDDISVLGSEFAGLTSPAAASTTSNTSSTRASSNGPVKEINPVNIDITKLKLPPKWKTARDGEGRLYYYHKETRVSQWYPPKWEEEEEDEEEVEVTDEESSGDDDSTEEEEEMAVPFKDTDDNEQGDEQAKIEAAVVAFADHKKRSDTEASQKTNEHREETNVAESKENAELAEDETTALNDASQFEEEAIDEPTGIPLVTEHIISPREPIDEEERIRNKLRRRYLKEKMRRRKKEKMQKNGLVNGHKNGSRSSKRRHRHMNGDSSGSKSSSSAADTSEASDEKIKDSFRFHMAKFIVTCLNPYFRSSCTKARITNNDDFKHLARKLTHFVMVKELKHCQNVTDLSCNASVKYKAKQYVEKYMTKFDDVYVRSLDDSNY